MSGIAFWIMLSGWLVAGALACWIHRRWISDWLEDLLDPPRPTPRRTTKQCSHVRLVERDA